MERRDEIRLVCARTAGIPARFVSGHFLRSDGMVNQEAGHAWAEAHIADLGWVGFDAANCICTTDAHVRVARRSPSPLHRYGGGAETLSVEVKFAGRPGQWQSQTQS